VQSLLKFLTEVQRSVVDFVFSFSEKVLHLGRRGFSPVNWWRWLIEIEVGLGQIVGKALEVERDFGFSTASDVIVS